MISFHGLNSSPNWSNVQLYGRTVKSLSFLFVLNYLFVGYSNLKKGSAAVQRPCAPLTNIYSMRLLVNH